METKVSSEVGPEVSSEVKNAFLLSAFSNLVSGKTIGECETVKDLEDALRDKIDYQLQNYKGALDDPCLLDPWQIVWGPTIYQAPLSKIADNAMVVFKHEDQVQNKVKYVVSIAGTNSEDGLSSFGWLLEDFFIGEQVPWWFGDPSPPGAKIGAGTLIGFLLLKNMKWKKGKFQKEVDLETFLKDEVQNIDQEEEVEITVAGHSLGGALSSVVALWLSDVHGNWPRGDKVTIKCVASAGPTAGNPDFATYFNEQFGENATRIYNNIDAIPLAWDNTDCIASIYDDCERVKSEGSIRKGLPVALNRLRDGCDYLQISGKDILLPGAINPDIPAIEPIEGLSEQNLRYIAQLFYQHVNAYFNLLKLNIPEPLEAASDSDYRATQLAALQRKLVEIQELAA